MCIRDSETLRTQIGSKQIEQIVLVRLCHSYISSRISNQMCIRDRHEAEPVPDKPAAAKHNRRKDHHHHNAVEQGADTRTKQSHLRKAQLSIDKYIVSYYVKRIRCV